MESHLINDLKPAVSIFYLWVLGGIALSVLIIACINFINIAIAMAGKRHVETGIKKVNGASANDLIRAFFLEMGIMVLLSLVLLFAMIALLFPYFVKLIGKEIDLHLTDPILLSGLLAFGIVTITLAGLYPALWPCMP